MRYLFFTFMISACDLNIEANTDIGPDNVTQSCSDNFPLDAFTSICYACTVKPETDLDCDNSLLEDCQNTMPGLDNVSPEWLDFLNDFYTAAFSGSSQKKMKKRWPENPAFDLNYQPALRRLPVQTPEK